MIWSHKIPVASPLQASPTGVADRIYCMSLEGEILVLAAGDEYRELAKFTLDDKWCRSSIVVVDGRLFVRTSKTFYCISW